MILGWFRRRKKNELTRDERAEWDAERREWERFAEEMHGTLQSVEELLDLERMEHEMPVHVSDTWHAQYINAWEEWRRYGRVGIPVLSRPVTMPLPDVVVDPPVHVVEHRAVKFRAELTLSHLDIGMRRTPASMVDLVQRVQEQLRIAMERRLEQTCLDPALRAAAVASAR